MFFSTACQVSYFGHKRSSTLCWFSKKIFFICSVQYLTSAVLYSGDLGS